MGLKSSRARRPGGAAGRASADIRDVLHEGVVGQMAGTEHAGDVQTGSVEHPRGGAAVEVDEEKREVRVWVKDAVTGRPVLATLYAPGNVLWRKPPKGDSVNIVTGANTGGPGAATALHGDGGNEDDVPEDLSDENTVLSPPAGDLLIQSRDGKVEIKSNRTGNTVATISLASGGGVSIDAASGQKITLNVSGAGVVEIGGNSFKLPKWDTFVSQLSTILSNLNTQLQLGTAGSPVKQQLVGAVAIATLIANFTASLGNGTFDSTKATNG